MTNGAFAGQTNPLQISNAYIYLARQKPASLTVDCIYLQLSEPSQIARTPE